MERKLFTALQGPTAAELNDCLSKQGFRRSQNVLYRPACAECNACLSARIDVSRFDISRSQKRVEKRNAGLVRQARSPWATEEQFELFRTYLEGRHADGGMADMDIFEFAAMVEETPIKTRLIEYSRETAAAKARLTAVCLTDVLDDGLSMVYSFFDPEMERNSIGTYVVLDHIRLAKDLGLSYVYLGYWVPGSQKMGYKSKFSGLEIFADGRWQAMDNPENFAPPQSSGSVQSIAEQVARIQMPQKTPPTL